MFNRKEYDVIGYDAETVNKLESMTDEQRQDLYSVAGNVLNGQPESIKTFASIFGNASFGTVNTVRDICYDSLSAQERSRLDTAANRKAGLLSRMDPESAAKRLDAEANELPKLTALRTKRGLTQAQLSEKSGINKMQISRIERGDIKTKNVSLGNAAALAAALDVKIEDLL